jgi:pyrroline-5-carboxylate reductase
MNIGFLGSGNLTHSLIKGLRAQNAPYGLIVYDIRPEAMQSLKELYAVRTAYLAELIKDSHVLVLAIKPDKMRMVFKEIGVYDLKQKLLISVAAGISLRLCEERLPGVPFVRAMPNTSSAVLAAVTGLAAGSATTSEQRETAEALFSALGKVLWLTEDKLNAVTALSGSGPAYFYYLTELMTEAGIELGLDAREAETLAAETLLGAGKMLAAERVGGTASAAQLRERVTSPGGTTAAALGVFAERSLPEIVSQAMLAASQRAAAMEQEQR